MREIFISVGCGWQQLNSIKNLKQRSLSVLSIDQSRSAAGASLSDEFLEIDIKDADRCISSLEEFSTKQNVKFIGVASFLSDAGQMTAALIAEHFKIPGPAVQVARVSSRKDLQKEICQKIGVRTAKGFVTSSLGNDIGIPFPVVVKPVDSAGSRGVYICKNSEELVQNFQKAISFSKEKKVAVEEFVDGIEYSVECLWVDGKIHPAAISKRELDGMSARAIVSARLSPDAEKRVIEAIDRFHQAIHFKNGVTHTELFINTTGEVVFGESACRGGGFGTSEYLATEVSGCNINEAYISLLLGKAAISLPILNSSYCALYFVPARKGIYLGLEKPEKTMEWLEVKELVPAGTETQQDGSDASRVAMVIIKASDDRILNERLTFAKNSLKAKYENI